MTQDFVHLRLHSDYSFRDSTVRVKQVVHKATAAGMKALALTDLGVMFGDIFFYKACLSEGIKPILGSDVWITNPKNKDAPFRILLLCRNQDGYHKLCEFLTKAWLENQVDGRGQIEMDWLTRENCDGLIALSGFQDGQVGRALLNEKHRSARAEAEALAALFPGRFYLELQRAKRPTDEKLVQETWALAQKLDIPVVATHPIQFQDEDGFLAHEIRCCIAQGTTLSNPRREKLFTKDQYFKSREEMVELFKDIPSAIENTVEIAKRCNLTLVLGKPRLPEFETPDGISLDDYMAQLSHEGLEKRLAILYPDTKKRDEVRPTYLERLEREIKVIQKMGFSGYFLIVQDFIRWAKANGCPVGPGRGSGAGSLVAFCLEITDLDPLEFGLLFERFLNPERVSMPDFDVDFCQNNRERVIEYVKRRYGADAVSQIATFGTMAAKGVIKDVGRVLDFSYSQTDQLAKFVPAIPGQNPTLEGVLEAEPEFRKMVSNDPEIKVLIENAMQLEGICRNIGIHAGGVLIAPGKLTDFCPLYAANMLPENVISQYDKKEVEEAGLVKFDFLGLTTLTIIARALDYIQKNTTVRPDIEHLVPTDKKVFDKIFKVADTEMIFQFESPGMKNIMIRSVPTKLSDLIALNALYRPGPMALADDFIDLRKGIKTPEYADPRLIPVLEETVGIMIYQEQVMQVAQIIGGYSLGGADILRRAMGKKDAAEMERQSKVFIEGAKKNGVTEDVAIDLFNKMRKFAEYGFNKSHAAAYSYVAYQTAWLKCYHPAEFIAANLCEVMSNATKLYQYISDAIHHGIKVLGPDINKSDFYFTSPDTKTIRFGLGALKGMGEASANAISSEREKDGPFKDMYDLVIRVGSKMVTRKVLEILSLGGAFDSIDPNRKYWYSNIENAYKAAQEKEDAANQISLFGAEEESPEMLMTKVEPWDELETVRQEKSVLGFYFSGSPLDSVRDEIKRNYRRETLEAIKYRDGFRQSFTAFGVVTSVAVGISKNTGNHFCSLTVDDGFRRIEMRVSQDIYESTRKNVLVDEVYCIEGVVSKPEKSENLSWNVNKITSLSDYRAMRQARLVLRLDPKADLKEFASVIGQMHGRAPGQNCRVDLLERHGDTEIRLPLSGDYGVVLSSGNLSKFRNLETVMEAHLKFD